MFSILLGIVFLLVCYLAIFLWNALPYILVGACVIAFVSMIIYLAVLNNYKTKIVKAVILDKEPIIKRVAENTGYTISYGRSLSSHEHYRYKNVITGVRVKFITFWKPI